VLSRELGQNPANKALWFIESHFAQAITLEDIANVAGVSRFHMVRAFEAATGQPVMRYARGRRLTEAARSLANGAPDILAVALEAAYNSHEAFTRAFRDQFGITPEQVRKQGHLENLQLTEAIKMMETVLNNLAAPRFENGKALLLAGASERYNCETRANIPAQWQRFGPQLGHIPGQQGNIAYGVCYNSDEDGNFDYLCGAEVGSFSNLPPEMARLRIPELRYAVFQHTDHISTIGATWNTIWSKWLPESGYKAADAACFERYDEKFDPVTGNGGLEIWVPIKG
jgi:AraC family transcriptional regulator